MFNNDNMPFFGTDLEDHTVTPIADNDLLAESTATTNNRVILPLDLNRELISSPASTFFARLQDESLKNEGDLLIIDKSINPYDGCLAVVFMDGEFTLKRIKVENNTTWLLSAKDNCKPIKIDSNNEYTIWGVVKYLIKKM